MADKTQSSITIAAPPAVVMDVIADLASYPEWSDGIASVEVLSVYEEDDRPADARFVLDSGVIKDTYELEYDWDGDASVAWKLTTAQMMTKLDGRYDLSANGDGTTDVRYTLEVDVKMPMIGMLKRKAEKTIVDTALKGLKARVESSPAAGS